MSFVTFQVKYHSVVFRPFKGEILEGVVSLVNKMGFFAEAGLFKYLCRTIWYQMTWSSSQGICLITQLQMDLLRFKRIARFD